MIDLLKQKSEISCVDPVFMHLKNKRFSISFSWVSLDDSLHKAWNKNTPKKLCCFNNLLVIFSQVLFLIVS